VTTTLDYPLQQQLNCTVKIQLQRLEGDSNAGIEPGQENSCEAALLLPTYFLGERPVPQDLLANALVMDPKSGEVLALLGQVNVNGRINTSLQTHPGSLLSPFVALSAFARGMSPANLVWDIPLEGDSDQPYASLADAHNPDGTFHGPVRLRTALANDYLLPVARLQMQIGSDNVWQQLQTLGNPDLSQVENPDRLLFSGGSVSLLSLAQAYSTFANLGLQYGRDSKLYSNPQPNLILQVEDTSGRILMTHATPVSRSLLSPQLAYLVQNVLGDEIARQPSMGYPNPLEIGRPVGVKIGQVAGNQQVWTLGYTPDILAAVWLGLPDGEDSVGSTQLEPEMAAGIWHAAMQFVERDVPVQNWEMPSGLMHMDVCDPSGDLPTEYCPLVVNELFLIGNQPATSDSLYQSFLINQETGKLATIFTPLEKVVEKIYLVPPPEAQQWAQEAGLPTPPRDYDAIQAPQPSPGVEISSPAQFAYVRGKLVIKGSATGDNFASYRLQVSQGLNPRSWIQIGQENNQPVEDGELAVWDTQGLDGLYAIRLTVVKEDHQLVTHVIQVSVDNNPPIIEVHYPEPEHLFEYTPGGTIHFRADVSDNIGVASVEWYLDGKKVGENTIAPYTIGWDMTVGLHKLQVKASDLAGNITESEIISFLVSE
jgi:membrane peptidoglycan carboxypeptidase